MAPIAPLKRPTIRTRAKVRSRVRPNTHLPRASDLENLPESTTHDDRHAAAGLVPSKVSIDSTHDSSFEESAFETFSRNKRDKQRVRRGTFLSRVEKSHASSKSASSSTSGLRSGRTRSTSRRKKTGLHTSDRLVAGLEEMLDALPTTAGTSTTTVDITTGQRRKIDGDEEMWADDDGETNGTRHPPRATTSSSSSSSSIMKMKSLKSRPGAQKRRAKMEEGERRRFGLNLANLTAGTSESAHRPVNAAADTATATTARVTANATADDSNSTAMMSHAPPSTHSPHATTTTTTTTINANLGPSTSSGAMTGVTDANGSVIPAASSDVNVDARAQKWAALRGFITQTMEHSPDFAKTQ